MGDEYFGLPISRVQREAGDIDIKDALDQGRAIINADNAGGGLELGEGIEAGLRNLTRGYGAGRVAGSAEYIRDTAMNTRRVLGELQRIYNGQGDMFNAIANLAGDVGLLRAVGAIGGLPAGFGREPRDPVAPEGFRRGQDAAGLLNNILGEVKMSDEQRAQIIGMIDADENGNVSSGELKSALDDGSIINQISSLSPAIARLFKDPQFRSRTIQRLPSVSIYGDMSSRDDYNQVNEVLQGIALDEESNNFFSVNF
jgi:hypothetical protein